MYPAKLGWRPWHLDLLLPSFLLSREEKALFRGRGSFSGYIHISWMPETWPASLMPWSSFAFFSCIKARKEGHEVRKSCVKRRKEGPEALLDFLMRPSFLSLKKEKKKKKLKPSAEGEEVFPDTSRIVEGLESLKLLDSKFVRSRMALDRICRGTYAIRSYFLPE